MDPNTVDVSPDMEGKRYTILPLGPHMGVEVEGLQAEDINEEIASFLKAELIRHKVLVLRNQHISSDEYLKLARCFGTPKQCHHAMRLNGYPEIARIVKTDQKNRGCEVRQRCFMTSAQKSLTVCLQLMNSVM